MVMDETVHGIEVYEWKAGSPRPATKRKARHDCIDLLDVPPEGQAPQIGDGHLAARPDRRRLAEAVSGDRP